MKYLLDTDTVSYFLRGDRKLRTRLSNTFGQWGISAITYSELAAHQFSTKSQDLEVLLSEFLKEVDVVPFDSGDALEAGRLQVLLKSAGNPIGLADTLIAGNALRLKLTLVTNNLKHFSRVPELSVVNWSVKQ